ncbi:hypothetical protein HDU76_011139 [Blyttiomyces sp. JEL0837]|nr:hypothetical protein HDU76_011139 [Blyttiomyces sp. JEL0837]
MIPASKIRTNVTIAIFLPYAIGDFYSLMEFEDAQIELAVNEINQDPDILPDTFINIIRVNNWDPDKSTDYNYVTSGGYATISAINVTQGGRGTLWNSRYFYNSLHLTNDPT